MITPTIALIAMTKEIKYHADLTKGTKHAKDFSKEWFTTDTLFEHAAKMSAYYDLQNNMKKHLVTALFELEKHGYIATDKQEVHSYHGPVSMRLWRITEKGKNKMRELVKRGA